MVSDFTPKLGPTSGLNAVREPIPMTITGKNFGTIENTDIEVIFRTSIPSIREFRIKQTQFYSRSHTEIQFPMPPGYGASLDVLVSVRKQISDAVPDKTFTYIAPTVTSILPKCGSHNCYGFQNPGFMHVADYPQIVSVTAKATGVSTVQLNIVKTFPLELGMQIQLQGMHAATGVATGK